MNTWSDFELVDPPAGDRARELWLQHAAGFIMVKNIRERAIEQIDPTLDGKVREAAVAAVDMTVYALMQLIDGVTGGLRNERREVRVGMVVELREHDEVVQHLDLFDGDGVCMGIHMWMKGEFGEAPVAREVAEREKK